MRLSEESSNKDESDTPAPNRGEELPTITDPGASQSQEPENRGLGATSEDEVDPHPEHRNKGH